MPGGKETRFGNRQIVLPNVRAIRGCCRDELRKIVDDERRARRLRNTRDLPRDPAGYALLLYSTLHALESAGVESIVVESPPDEAEWVEERLRAAGLRG